MTLRCYMHRMIFNQSRCNTWWQCCAAAAAVQLGNSGDSCWRSRRLFGARDGRQSDDNKHVRNFFITCRCCSLKPQPTYKYMWAYSSAIMSAVNSIHNIIKFTMIYCWNRYNEKSWQNESWNARAVLLLLAKPLTCTVSPSNYQGLLGFCFIINFLVLHLMPLLILEEHILLSKCGTICIFFWSSRFTKTNKKKRFTQLETFLKMAFHWIKINFLSMTMLTLCLNYNFSKWVHDRHNSVHKENFAFMHFSFFFSCCCQQSSLIKCRRVKEENRGDTSSWHQFKSLPQRGLYTEVGWKKPATRKKRLHSFCWIFFLHCLCWA